MFKCLAMESDEADTFKNQSSLYREARHVFCARDNEGRELLFRVANTTVRVVNTIETKISSIMSINELLKENIQFLEKEDPTINVYNSEDEAFYASMCLTCLSSLKKFPNTPHKTSHITTQRRSRNFLTMRT